MRTVQTLLRLLVPLLLFLCTGTAQAALSPPSLLTDFVTATDATSYTTANISPGANTLITTVVFNRLIGTPNTPTLTGCSMTWTQNDTATSNGYRITVFRSTSASPGSACALTADFASQTQLDGWIFVYQWDDAAITGTNGSDGIVQSVDDAEGGASVTAASITLASFADATNNAAFGCWTHGSASIAHEGSGFTLLGDRVAGSARRATCEYKIGEDTTVDITWESTGVALGIAMEIAEGAAGGVAGSLVNGVPLRSLVNGGLVR